MLKCSFCGKEKDHTFLLIAKNENDENSPAICDGCVDLCVEIIAEKKAALSRKKMQEYAAMQKFVMDKLKANSNVYQKYIEGPSREKKSIHKGAEEWRSVPKGKA